jgi:hypothetical protein
LDDARLNPSTEARTAVQDCDGSPRLRFQALRSACTLGDAAELGNLTQIVDLVGKHAEDGIRAGRKIVKRGKKRATTRRLESQGRR